QDKPNCFPDFNGFFLSPETNFDISNDVTTSNDTFNEDFVYQNMIPSPELSIASSLSPELFDQVDCEFEFRYPEQPLDGMFNEQFNVQQTKCDDNLFNYYPNPEFNNNLTFTENLSNENISSQEFFDGSINFQPANIESNALYLYDNNVNYSSNSSNGLGIFTSSL